MKVVNRKTGIDITSHVIKYMEGKITKDEFERITALGPRAKNITKK